MNLARFGNRVINLDYLVEAAENDPAPGQIRLVMVRGRVLELTGQAAVEMRAVLAELVPPVPAPDAEFTRQAPTETWRDRPPLI